MSVRQQAAPEKRTSFLHSTTGEGRNGSLLGNWRALRAHTHKLDIGRQMVVGRPDVCQFADTRNRPVVSEWASEWVTALEIRADATDRPYLIGCQGSLVVQVKEQATIGWCSRNAGPTLANIHSRRFGPWNHRRMALCMVHAPHCHSLWVRTHSFVFSKEFQEDIR